MINKEKFFTHIEKFDLLMRETERTQIKFAFRFSTKINLKIVLKHREHIRILLTF